MSETGLERLLARQKEALPGSFEPRQRALEAFLERGFPTRRDEAWRYTDLKPIAEADFDAPAAPSEALRARVREKLAEVGADAVPASPRIVLIDGVLDDALSNTVFPAGIEMSRLAADTRHTGTARAATATHPLALLNRAFGRDAVQVRVTAAAGRTPPLELFLVTGGAGRIAQHPRIELNLEANAELDVIVHCFDAERAEGWLNVVFDISQADGSRLTLHRLQEHHDGLDHTSLLSAKLGKDAFLETGYVDVGGRVTRNDVDVELAGRGASANIFGVFFAAPGRHIDDEIRIDHAAPDTRSDTAFRGIADRKGRGVFRGKILVRPGAQRIDAQQRNDNLLLDEQAEINTRPDLEIYADDVKCSHGATVGEINDDQIFYLRARGIDEESARSLLTFAFANTLLQRVAPDRLRERAVQRVAGRLGSVATWESLE